MIGYLDLETIRLADEVGGWEFASDMGISVACLYVDEERAYRTYVGPDNQREGAFCYEGEDDTEDLVRDLVDVDMLVGFNIKEFDLRVLQPYAQKFGVSIKTPVFDILEALGKTVNRPFPASLESLSSINLGKLGQKLIDPKEAIGMYRKGLVDEVILYCMHDVWNTRMLFQIAYHTGEIKMRSRRGTYEVIDVSDWKREIHQIYGGTHIEF